MEITPKGLKSTYIEVRKGICFKLSWKTFVKKFPKGLKVSDEFGEYELNEDFDYCY